MTAGPNANQDQLTVANATNIPMQMFDNAQSMNIVQQTFRPPLPPSVMRQMFVRQRAGPQVKNSACISEYH